MTSAPRRPRRTTAGLFVKRAYLAPEPGDGLRVLVDRLWPRGLRKDVARIDVWLAEVAPSTELRHWFNHDPARWSAFQRRYQAELRDKPEALARLRGLVARGPVTLLFGARDVEHNNAVALARILSGRAKAPSSR